jgi:protoheme IX farnesyltransferase
MLIPLTIMPTVVGISGLLYGIAALLLGARFLYYCWKILHEEGVSPTTWKMYKFSLSYLALLFVAMAVDRWIPYGHRAPPPQLLILDAPAASADSAAHAH